MFRHPSLPCACFAIALGAAVAASSAWSQDRSTPERLDRLERDLNMLQRQVYRGVPPPMMGGDAGGAVNVEIRMDRLEAQMRELTGRVEEFANQVTQLRQRLDQINGDVDVRLGQAGSPPAFPGAAATPPSRPGSGTAGRPPRQLGLPPPGSDDDETTALQFPGRGPASLTPPAAAARPDAPSAGPTAIFGTLTPPGERAAPPERPNTAHTSAPAAGGVLPSGSPSEQYNYAFGLLKQADYPAAEAALKAFVDRHPKDGMAGSAQYWLGETYYTRGMYLEAASAFAEGYKHYPKSAKAADDLLKLGMSLARANQKQNACLALAQLNHDFPHPAATVRERAAAEKKRLGC